MLRKDMILEDGSILQLEPLNGKEDASRFRSFINALVQENTFLLVERPVTLREEIQWLKNQHQAQKKGEQIYLKALLNGKLIGNGLNTKKSIWMNVSFCLIRNVFSKRKKIL